MEWFNFMIALVSTVFISAVIVFIAMSFIFPYNKEDD